MPVAATMSRHILVVDDATAILTHAILGLEHAGYPVHRVTNAADALLAMVAKPPQLVILDGMLPDIDGQTVCARLRSASNVPIIVLVARDDPRDIARHLDSGADACLPPPFSLQELVARVHAVLRQMGEDFIENELRWLDLVLDRATRQVHLCGRRIDLSTREFALIEALMERPHMIHTSTQLLSAVWGDGERNAKVLKTSVSVLRQKLGDHRCRLIRSVRGVGYTLGG